MVGRPTKLKPAIHERIVSYIRAGVYAWVAAEAAGVSKTTFYRWLQRGDQEGSGPYRDFADEVRQAQAQARAGAEIEVRRDSPQVWLRYGPGRDRPDAPGWTDQRQITGLDGGALQLREVDDAALRAIARRILAE